MPQIAHFQVEKWKSSLPWGREDTPLPHPPPARSLRSLAKIVPPPPNVLAHYATARDQCYQNFQISTVHNYSALIWQKEASDKSDISRKRAKCVCHLHWRQWNIMMSYLTYLLVGWVFLHEIWPGRRAHCVNYENINNSNLDGMSLASFCQSRAVLYSPWFMSCM